MRARDCFLGIAWQWAGGASCPAVQLAAMEPIPALSALGLLFLHRQKLFRMKYQVTGRLFYLKGIISGIKVLVSCTLLTLQGKEKKNLKNVKSFKEWWHSRKRIPCDLERTNFSRDTAEILVGEIVHLKKSLTVPWQYKYSAK